jgi:hypothetical protein
MHSPRRTFVTQLLLIKSNVNISARIQKHFARLQTSQWLVNFEITMNEGCTGTPRARVLTDNQISSGCLLMCRMRKHMCSLQIKNNGVNSLSPSCDIAQKLPFSISPMLCQSPKTGLVTIMKIDCHQPARLNMHSIENQKLCLRKTQQTRSLHANRVACIPNKAAKKKTVIFFMQQLILFVVVT